MAVGDERTPLQGLNQNSWFGDSNRRGVRALKRLKEKKDPEPRQRSTKLEAGGGRSRC